MILSRQFVMTAQLLRFFIASNIYNMYQNLKISTNFPKVAQDDEKHYIEIFDFIFITNRNNNITNNQEIQKKTKYEPII